MATKGLRSLGHLSDRDPEGRVRMCKGREGKRGQRTHLGSSPHQGRHLGQCFVEELLGGRAGTSSIKSSGNRSHTESSSVKSSSRSTERSVTSEAESRPALRGVSTKSGRAPGQTLAFACDDVSEVSKKSPLPSTRKNKIGERRATEGRGEQERSHH